MFVKITTIQRMSVKKDEEKGEANKNKEINRRNRKKK
jgi:hypothetical protein